MCSSDERLFRSEGALNVEFEESVLVGGTLDICPSLVLSAIDYAFSLNSAKCMPSGIGDTKQVSARCSDVICQLQKCRMPC